MERLSHLRKPECTELELGLIGAGGGVQVMAEVCSDERPELRRQMEK